MAATDAPSCPRRVPGLRSDRRATALNVYFDTSAVVKLIIDEEGTETADELWRAADTRTSSHLVYPEARAALAAAARARRINQPRLRRAVSDLDALTSSISLIGVDQTLARSAGELAQRHALRGYDAVHLATALSTHDPELLVVTWDRDLAAAALDRGHPVAPATRAV